MRLLTASSALRRFLFLTLFGILFAVPAGAAEILVRSTFDGIADGDGCSLREALLNAQRNDRSGSYECARGEAGSVDTLLLPPDAISLNEPIVVSSDLVIKGGSATWSIIDAKGRGRIFDVLPGVKLTLRGVELTGAIASDEGAAVRVQAGAALHIEHVVISNSAIVNPAGGGGGAGIHIAENATATIKRSQIVGNQALNPLGRGGGVYCAARCTLDISNSTVNSNQASLSGGGVYLEGNASFEFVTVSGNSAQGGGGIFVSGKLQLFGTLMADNGAGTLGSDLDCAGSDPASAVSAQGPSLVEMPGVDCSAVPQLMTRATTMSGMEADVLDSAAGTYYNEAPSRVQRPIKAFFPFVLRQIAPGAGFILPGRAERFPCAELNDKTLPSYGDQHGRARAVGDRCDLGAYQKPMLEWRRLGLGLQNTSDPFAIPFSLDEIPVGPVTLRLDARPGGGIGEECGSNFQATVTLAPGVRNGSFVIQPSSVFDGPALNRPARVCEYEVLVDAPADPRLHGATAGNTRVRIQGISASQAGVSNPAPATYIEFKTVPVGSGGVKTLLLSPAVGGFHVTAVSVEGADKDKFEVVSNVLAESAAGSREYLPPTNTSLPVLSGSLGGTPIQLRCRPGLIGDFEAQLTVNTDSGTYGELSYGLRCTTAHFLAYSISESQVSEDGRRSELVITLDSPCLLDADGPGASTECFGVEIVDTAGSATPLLDYEALPARVVFMRGDTRKSVPLIAVNDDAVEGDEVFGVRVVPPVDVPYLKVPSVLNQWMTIKDNDEPLRTIKAFIRQLPASAEPGELVPFVVSVHNRGTEVLQGATIEVAVEQPMWIKNFALAGAECQIDKSKRRAVCSVGSVLVGNLIPPLPPPECDEAPCEEGPARYTEADFAADEVNEARWDDADWVHIYGRLVTADMTRPPTIDVRGLISTSASAGRPAEVAATTRSLLINAPPLQILSGAIGLHWLVLMLLPFRRGLLEAVGRKTERWRRWMSS